MSANRQHGNRRRRSRQPAAAPRRRDGQAEVLEREARRAARDIAREAEPASVSAGTRPAAALPPGAVGPGEVPAPGLRARLERGLGADLSALRIHRDARAARLAQAEGARAFAAGRDLVFGAGTWQPGTASGFALVAHEAAHALQQAGRPGPGGRLRLVDGIGSGQVSIQRDPLPGMRKPDPPRLQDLSTGDEFWRSLTHIYKTIAPFSSDNSYSSGEGYEAEVDRIDEAAGGRLTLWTPTPASGRLATWAATKARTLAKFRARCLLYDTLKLSGETDAAQTLLRADPRLETTVYPKGYIEAVQKSFVLEARAIRFIDGAESKYVLKQWNGMLDRLRALVTRPGEPLLDASPVRAEWDRLMEMEQGGDRLLLNVAQALAIRDIADVEDKIIAGLKATVDGDAVKQTGEFSFYGLPATSPYLRLRAFSGKLDILVNGAPDRPPIGFVARLRTALGPDARNAFRIADLALGLAGRLAEASTFGHAITEITDRVKGRAVRLAASPPFTAFLDGLAKLAAADAPDGIFGLVPEEAAEAAGGKADDSNAVVAPLPFRERMLDAAEFNKRLGGFASAVASLKTTLEEALAERAVGVLSDDRSRPDARTAILVLQFWAEWFLSWAASLEVDAATNDPDTVALQRYRAGQALFSLGSVAGHKLLADAGRRIAQAGEAMLSYAILPAPGFVEDKSVPMERLREEGAEVRLHGQTQDEGGDRLATGLGEIAVDSAMLVDFYQLEYLTAVLPRIDAEITYQSKLVKQNLELPPDKEVPLPPANSVQSIVDEVREGTPHPRYWKVENGHLVRNARDSASANQTLERHPAINALLGAPSRNPPDWAKPAPWKGLEPFRNPDNWNSVHTWTLPPMGSLVAKLETIEPVQKILKIWDQEGIPKPAHPVDWLMQLYRWMKDRGEIGKIRGSVTGVFARELKDRNAELRIQMRNLSTLNRRLTLDYIKDRLGKLSDRDLAFEPNLVGDVTGAIQRFSAGVGPADDRDLQLVALMIEAADEIARVIAHRTGYQHVQAFFNPVALALAMATDSVVFGMDVTEDGKKVMADDPVAANELPAGTIAPQFPERMKALDIDKTTVRDGVTKLRAILQKLDEARRKAQDMWVLHGTRSDGLNTSLASTKITPGTEDATFVMALPHRFDVHEGEGDWEPAVRPKSPLDQATQAPDAEAGAGTEAGAAEPKKKEWWQYNGIVYTDYPILYRIDEVYEDFEYTPEYRSGVGGAADRKAKLKRKGGGTFRSGTPLMKITFSRIYEEEGEPRFAPERTVTIRAGDDRLLELMTKVIDNHARMTQLRNLADAIEFGAEAILDLLEFVPGLGQVIMVARLGVNIAQLLTDPSLDWDKIKEEVMEKPGEIVQLIRDDFIGELTPDSIWRLLLGQAMDPSPAVTRMRQALDKAAERSRTRPGAALQSAPKHEKNYRKFLKAIMRVGKRFAMAVGAAQKRLEVGVNSAQGNVAGNPILFKHFSRIDQYLIWVETLAAVAEALKDVVDADALADKKALADHRDAEQSDFKGAAGDLGTAVTGMVQPLQELELPGEVFPLDLAIQIVLEFVLGKVRNRKFRVVYEALRLTGGLSLISRTIAEKLLAGTDADPNKHWREGVLPKIETPFVEGRNDLVDTIYATINELIPSARVTKPSIAPPTMTAAPFVMEDVEAGLAETVPFLRHGDPRLAAPLLPPDEPGAPMPRHLLDRMQGEFGHDLGHVRLHTGREADAYVQGTGAEALASGSHIWLREPLMPGAEPGEHVLRHEIAHVLQQTGARPLGARHGPTPAEGRPGRGLQLDPDREAAAERMAARSRGRSATDEGPMDIDGAGPLVLSPFGRTDMVRFLHRLTRNAHPRDFARKLESEPKLKRGGKTAAETAEGLYGDLVAKLKANAVTRSARMGYGSQGSVITELNEYLYKQLRLPTNSDVPLRIASRAIVKLPERQRTRNNIYKLDPQSFLNILEGFVFSQAGVRLTLKDNPTQPSTIGSATIRSLHLGGIAENSKPYARIKKAYEAAPHRDLTFATIRAYLRARFPLPHRWKKNISLELHRATLDEIYAATHRPSTVKPEDLPDWNTYANPKTRPVTSGIRVANHRDLTGGGAAPDRESHHLPQFLLAEFYSGMSSTSPFEADGDLWVPGFTRGTSGKVTRANRRATPFSGFQADGLALDFAALGVEGSGRGKGMPAVSLAADTHQKGGLHLHRESHWNDPTDTKKHPTQSFTLSNRHRDVLRTEVKKANVLSRNDETWKGPLDDGPGFKAHVDAVVATGDAAKLAKLKTAAGKAVKRSYGMFVGVMEPPLRTALMDIEAPYYVGLASQRSDYADTPGNPYRGPAGDTGWVDTVIGALKEQNRKVYGQWFDGRAWS